MTKQKLIQLESLLDELIEHINEVGQEEDGDLDALNTAAEIAESERERIEIEESEVTGSEEDDIDSDDILDHGK